MKTHKLFTPLFLTLSIFSIFLYQSCSQDNSFQSTQADDNIRTIIFNSNMLSVSQTFENYTLEFQVENKNNLLKSEFTVSDIDDNIIYKTNYNLDTTDQYYKFNQSEKVLNIAKQMNYDLDDLNYATIISNMDRFASNILNEFRDKNIGNMFSLLYFHNSIINVKYRSVKTNNECECTLHPGYIMDKLGFMCQEDYMIPTNLIREYIDNDSLMSIGFNDKNQKILFKEYINTLISDNRQQIPFDEMQSFFMTKNKFNSYLGILKKSNYQFFFRCWLSLGASWGCCGNYGGCCWYWHWACYAHDWYCSDCRGGAWYCGWACVPDNPEP